LLEVMLVVLLLLLPAYVSIRQHPSAYAMLLVLLLLLPV
jgi:hypothetical protein